MANKILVVDDDLNICEVLKLYLENDGYEVKCAGDGVEAVEVFKIFEPDIVLLDIMMPGKDGWQVCREIREHSAKPIIMLSAKGEVFDKVLNSAARIARRCQELGITCLYEEQGLYFNGVQNFGRFFRAIKQIQSNVGVCGDFGNILFADEAATDFFQAFQKDILHVHLKDYFLSDDISAQPDPEAWLKSKGGKYVKDAPLGKGVTDCKKCLDILKKADYQGFFSLELVNPVQNNPLAMEYCKRNF